MRTLVRVACSRCQNQVVPLRLWRRSLKAMGLPRECQTDAHLCCLYPRLRTFQLVSWPCFSKALPLKPSSRRHPPGENGPSLRRDPLDVQQLLL